MAFVRVKRRLQDDPKEVLLLTSSKKPKTETAVFKFAATVDKQEDNVSLQIRQAVNLKGLKSHYQKTVKNITENSRLQSRSNSQRNRLKIVNCFRAIDYTSLSDGEEVTTEGSGKTLTVIDLESCDGRNDEIKSSSDSKGDDSSDQFVYDIYYTDCVDVTETLAETYSSGYGINQEFMVEEFSRYEEDSSSCDLDYEDDSNDENNWRNDYPDEDEFRSGSEEDDLEYGMRRCNLNRRSDLSSDDGEEELVYNDGIDPKDVYLFGSEYAKYKSRINGSIKDESSDDDG